MPRPTMRSKRWTTQRPVPSVLVGPCRWPLYARRYGQRRAPGRPKGLPSRNEGETADQSSAQPLPAGSFFALPPGTAHYVYIGDETVIQINTIGPWGLAYINPSNDPRSKSQ